MAEPSEFERLLADPNEQFDPASEVLFSIAEYQRAEPATASAPRRTTCPACRIPSRPDRCPDSCWCGCHPVAGAVCQ